MSENKIRGGALLARALKDKGISKVFTLSGGFCNPAIEGFAECQIEVINTPHEQIAGHLADGNTRITRKPSVCLVGPEGFTNAVPSMMEAWGERSPIIYITGSSSLKRQGSGGFKEIDDVSIAAPLTKYSASITDGTRIREFVDKAYHIATNGYPGAVHLSLPVDIMFSSFAEEVGLEERPYSQKAKPIAKAWPDPNSLSEVLELACNSKKPVIIGGHGVWWSHSEKNLEAAGNNLNIPIFNVPYHQKLLGEEANAYMGLADIHQYPPSEFALKYASEGVDELLYIDSVASLYGRNSLAEILKETSSKVFVPITASGGIRSVEDASKLLAFGADKIALNTAAIKNPSLISELSRTFGSQCVVISIQARKLKGQNAWEAMYEMGRERSGKDVLNWINGPITEVSSFSTNILNKLEAEDTAVSIFKFKNNSIGTFEATTSARPYDHEASLTILFEKGIFEIGGIALNKIIRFQIFNSRSNFTSLKKKFSENVKTGYGRGHIPFYENVIKNLLNNSIKSPINVNDSIYTTRLVHSMYYSIENKMSCKLSDYKISRYLGKKIYKNG